LPFDPRHLFDPRPAGPVVEEILDEGVVPRSPKVAALWAWWRRNAGDDIPAWSRFDPLDHPALLPNIFLVHRVGSSFVFRLHGEQAIAMIGCNPRGKRIDPGGFGQIGFEGNQAHRLHDYYSRVLASRRCWRCSGKLPHRNRSHVRFESIDVPLSRHWPEADTILGVLDTV
jgi:hypothetical protein